MFLFTTPSPTATPPPTGPTPVIDAIRQGATTTGTDFDYLVRTAKRESALDPNAKAPTSSATGLFQFIEQTWLGLVKSDGDKAGLGNEARAVTARGDGSFGVSDPETRQAILKLREDPRVASVMAGALTQQNRDALAGSLGRQPTGGELYMAHVLGARGAAELVGARQTNPTRAAALDFPEAARANRGIFFDRAGRARGAGEVYDVLSAAQAGTAQPGAAASDAARTVAPVAAAQPKGLQGLFQTGIRPGPVSDAVSKIWRSHDTAAPSRSAALAFFPRTNQSPDAEPAPAEAAPQVVEAWPDIGTASRPADPSIPLPPARPSASVLAAPAAARASGRPKVTRAFTEAARP